MKQDVLDSTNLSYEPCRYGMSRIFFRGPKRDLNRPYVAFLGSTETFGKFIERPFPALLEKQLRRPCVNFGCVNGGVDAFMNDLTLMDACHDADMAVVQVIGANNLSNRFYSVHPRRNDRFVRASTVLQAIYNEVDFSEFTFTRHMLKALYSVSTERFETVVMELRQAWLARMKTMLIDIGPRTILLWFSRDPLTDDQWYDRENPLAADPLFITQQMIEELRPLVMEVVVVTPSAAAIADGVSGMIFPPIHTRAAQDMLGVRAHQEAAEVLKPRLQECLREVGRL